MSSLEGSACLDEAIIAAFVAGELDPPAVERVDAHLATCGDCLWLVAASIGPDSLLSEQLSPESLPGRFERHHLIAQGGMGAVYYGYDREAQSAVAIKQLKPGLALSEPALLGRFMREATILQRLDHPNIVKMIASVTSGKEHQIVMEYVSGGSLRQLLRVERRLPAARAAAIVLELADALSRAHHLGVIHRDIKPENVLITSDGSPKLGDFGLAMLVDAGLSTPNAMLGTIAYLSPEALSGQVLDARADLWALGVMLFEMLTGRRPFEASIPAALVMAILQQPTPDLEALCPDTPVELLDLVSRLLQKDRNQRIGSARQVGVELEAISRAPRALALLGSARSLDGASRSLDAAPTMARLPVQTTPFIGRAAELAELAQLLGDVDVRAVTIIGPGGMGKSRLAVEAARRLASEAEAGPAGSSPASTRATGASRAISSVFFVDLAPLGSADSIGPAVAEAVGFQFRPGGDPKRQLLDYFREKRLLLLLDNFEHVIAGAAFVNELLTAAAGVKVLATSRQRLGLRAEAQFTLAGMNPVDAASAVDPAAISAVRLFVDNARRTRFGFEPSRDESREIAHICRLVHGVPLAIVLAAAWIDTLSLPEIAAEIGKSMDFLQSEAGDLPSRQQSIRAVFDHSWGLLQPEEREALAAVSLFRGGFTRAAAEAIAGASLRTLASLVAKSLLRRVPETGRYEIHQLLRQYAEARLASAPARLDAAMDRLAAFYAGFLHERGPRVFGPERQQVFVEIQADLDNIRVAWQWMVEHRQAARLWSAFHVIGQFYHTNRSRLEGERLMSSVVSAFDGLVPGAAPEEHKVLGLALLYQSFLCDLQGHRATAVELVKRSVALLSTVAHDEEYALAMTMFAWTCTGVAEPREVIARLEEGLLLLRAVGSTWWLVRSLITSCRVYLGTGELGKAEDCLRESIALQKSLGDGSIVYPDSLVALGVILCSQGLRREGRDLLLDGLRTAEAFDDGWTILLALQFAARAHRDLGDYVAAEAFVRRGIACARELGSFETAARCHVTLGGILREQGRFTDAIAEYESGARESGGDVALIAKAELGLGELALQRGDYARAEPSLVKSLRLCEQHQIRRGLRDVLEALGYLACHQGRHDEALDHLRRAFELSRGRQKPSALIGVLVGLAWWCAKSGRPVRAAELISLARNHPATAHPLQVRRIEPLLVELETQLGAADLEAAITRGKSAPLEAALEASFS